MTRVNGPGRKSTRVASITAVLLALYASLSGCAGIHDWDAMRGRVLGAENKGPIRDVVVVYRWIGTASNFAGTSDVCYHLESAVTDANGLFVIPAWSESLLNWQHLVLGAKRYWIAVAYKPGYVVSDLTYKEEALRQHIVYLEKQKSQSREDRLWDLVGLIGRTDCEPASEPASEQRQKILGFYRAIYREAVGSSQTSDDQKILEKLEYDLASRWDDSGASPTREEARAIFKNQLKPLLQ